MERETVTIHIPSLFLGALGLSLFSGALFGLLILIDRWQAKKERPTNVRSN